MATPNIRFYTRRAIPVGTNLHVEIVCGMPIVSGSVPGGPKVVAPSAMINGEIVLDDNLWFEHELNKPTITLPR